jgi:hypothetical protein
MFGSNYAENFGLPGFPWTNLDPQGGFYQPNFTGMAQGQPVPGTPGGGGHVSGAPGPSANPSVPAIASASPLAQGGASPLAGAAGAPVSPGGAGSPAVAPDALGGLDSGTLRPSRPDVLPFRGGGYQPFRGARGG